MVIDFILNFCYGMRIMSTIESDSIEVKTSLAISEAVYAGAGDATPGMPRRHFLGLLSAATLVVSATVLGVREFFDETTPELVSAPPITPILEIAPDHLRTLAELESKDTINAELLNLVNDATGQMLMRPKGSSDDVPWTWAGFTGTKVKNIPGLAEDTEELAILSVAHGIDSALLEKYGKKSTAMDAGDYADLLDDDYAIGFPDPAAPNGTRAIPLDVMAIDASDTDIDNTSSDTMVARANPKTPEDREFLSRIRGLEMDRRVSNYNVGAEIAFVGFGGGERRWAKGRFLGKTTYPNIPGGREIVIGGLTTYEPQASRAAQPGECGAVGVIAGENPGEYYVGGVFQYSQAIDDPIDSRSPGYGPVQRQTDRDYAAKRINVSLDPAKVPVIFSFELASPTALEHLASFLQQTLKQAI